MKAKETPKTAVKTITLRSLGVQDAIKGTEYVDLPIAHEGTFEECKGYAELMGYEWKKENNVFGGYFVATSGDGHCLIPV